MSVTAKQIGGLLIVRDNDGRLVRKMNAIAAAKDWLRLGEAGFYRQYGFRYNRLRSDDIDALRFNMFPMRIFKDASQETMDAVKIAPGAVVDAQTDPASANQVDARILETQFGYDARIEHTLDRTKGDMYEALSVPNVSPDQLKNFVTSGKTMKALYWGLTCRCEEKWNAWDAALIWMVDALLRMAKVYSAAPLPEV